MNEDIDEIEEEKLDSIDDEPSQDEESLIERVKNNPKKEYSSTDIEKLQIFPWAKSSRSIVTIIERDRSGENILEAKIDGKGTHLRYRISHRNIIKFLKRYAPVLINTTHQPK